MYVPKTAIAIGIVAVIIAAALYMVPAYDWDEGAPEATIHVAVAKSDGTTYAGDLELGDNNLLSSLTAVPLTTYTADVPPVDPLTTYTIAFTITVITAGSVPESYTTAISITGHNNRTEYPVKDKLGPREYSTTAFGTNRIAQQSQPTEYNTEAVFSMPAFVGSFQTANTGDACEIWGEAIDGSVFLINIVSEGASGSYGMTSATVELSVGAGGDLEVQISDISTTVTG